MMLIACEVEFAEATCSRVPHHIYTHPLRRSGLLPFFSPPVIQEWLINFAGERQRSRMTSHCEIILGFCLSASHPAKLNSGSQDWRPLPVVAARLVPSPLRYSGPVIQSWAFALVSCVVEFAIAEMACVSRNVRTTRSESLLFCFKSFALWRIFQRSISERDCSHPVISSDSKTRLIVQRSFGTLRSRP